MSINDCINEAVVSGALSEKGAKEYRDRMKQHEENARQRGMGVAEAATFAQTEAAKELEARNTAKRAQVRDTIFKIDRAWEGAKANEHGLQWGLTDVFGEHVRGKGSGVSLAQMQRGNYADAQRIMADVFARLQSRMLGLKRNTVLPVQVVSALFGRDVADPAAKTAAEAWNAFIDHALEGLQRNGVFIRNKDDWRIFQKWSPNRVRAETKDQFVAQMQEWWHDKKLLLRDWEADGQAYMVPGLHDERATEIFARTYDNIVDPNAQLEPGMPKQRKTMGDRYGRRRVYEWASDDAWHGWNDRYGVGREYIGEAMLQYVDHLTRDLALAQVLGPDHERAAEILLDMAAKDGVTPKWIERLRAMHDINSGKAMMPVDQNLAMGMQSARAFLTSAQLGGTLLGSVPDFAFTRSSASWYGLDMTRLMTSYLKGLKPSSLEDRASAMRAGNINEVGMRGFINNYRDAFNDFSPIRASGNHWSALLSGTARVTGHMAEAIIRGQGLAAHTQNLRNAWGSEVMDAFGRLAGKGWGELEGIQRRFFTEYGMGEKDWDLIRRNGMDGGFMSPAKLARTDDGYQKELATKLLGAISTTAHIAVPEGNSVTRAFLMAGGARPGTWPGELTRSLGQYKGFIMSAMMSSWFRAMETLADGEGKWNRAQWVMGLVVGTTVMGALANQLKDIAAGKDPEPIYGPHAARFWLRAFAQGGAGGILGNEMQSIVQAQRLDDASRAVTPMAGLGLDVAQLIAGPIHGQANLNASGTTRETYAMGAARFARKYTPMVWELRLILDRLGHDTLTRMVDPQAGQAFQRLQDRARKEGTAYWWRPGSSANWPSGGNVLPQRVPNLENAVP